MKSCLSAVCRWSGWISFERSWWDRVIEWTLTWHQLIERSVWLADINTGMIGQMDNKLGGLWLTTWNQVNITIIGISVRNPDIQLTIVRWLSFVLGHIPPPPPPVIVCQYRGFIFYILSRSYCAFVLDLVNLHVSSGCLKILDTVAILYVEFEE